MILRAKRGIAPRRPQIRGTWSHGGNAFCGAPVCFSPCKCRAKKVMRRVLSNFITRNGGGQGVKVLRGLPFRCGGPRGRTCGRDRGGARPYRYCLSCTAQRLFRSVLPGPRVRIRKRLGRCLSAKASFPLEQRHRRHPGQPCAGSGRWKRPRRW